MDASRSEVLKDLVELARPMADLNGQLLQFPWNCDKELVVLKHEHVADVLRRYLNGSLPSKEVEEWADAIEMREDIAFEESPPDLVADAIFFLANPSLDGALTESSAGMWLLRLTSGRWSRDRPQEPSP